jgi:hypothetical protein
MLPTVAPKTRKISVLLEQEDYERFDSYCRTRGYKKSTLASKLIRDLLDREQAPMMRQLIRGGKREKTG